MTLNIAFSMTKKVLKEFKIEHLQVMDENGNVDEALMPKISDEEIKKAVMSIPTDSKGIEDAKNPTEDKVFALHKLFASPAELAELEARYTKTGASAGIGYKESKEILIKNISAFIKPLREKRERIAMDIDSVLEILQEGGRRAKEVAEAKMKDVREKIGVTLY